MARVVTACLLLLGACARLSGTFACEESTECVRGASAGTCEATGYCSFDDPSCPSGARYVDEAPVELAGTCVGLPGDDAAPPADANPTVCGTEIGTVYTSPITTRCYARIEGALTHLAANRRCTDGALGVAMFSTPNELTDVTTHLLPSSLPASAYHLGLVSKTDRFVWYDGAESPGLPWAAGEPSSISDRVGVFAHTAGAPFELHAGTQAELAGVLCEEPATATRGTSRYVHFDGTYASGDGLAVCAELGGTLAAITSDEENFFVGAMLGTGNTAKIGLTDVMSEGAYVWPTGEPYVYEDWGGGEPNDDSASGDEDCALLVGGSDPSWFDADCGTRATGFICEIPI